MQFGINFFPSVDPVRLSGQEYYRQALALAARADELGYHHIRTVEHYFRGYGGYSPSPIVFLTAVSQRTQRVRLVTGAVLPVFNHPLKLAAELAMLDCLSNGRLDAGFARAFLPEEFDAFQVPMDESEYALKRGFGQSSDCGPNPRCDLTDAFINSARCHYFPDLCNSHTRRSGLRRSKPLNRLPGLENRGTT